jgi:formimidoylglutamase
MIEDASWPRADSWLARNDKNPSLVVIGVPTSVASLSPSKAYQTPNRLRGVLGRFSTFHSDRAVDVRTLSVADLGDWQVSSLGLEEYQDAIEASARRLAKGPVYAFLGGDNGITRPLAGGLSRRQLGRVGLLTFDAHHDVRTLDRGPTNGTPIRGLIEDGLPGEQIIQIGIQSFANSLEYRAYCDDHRIRIATMDTVDAQGLEPVVGAALEGLGRQCEWIYVDFDIDVLDRAFAPACPAAQPGGMRPRQLAGAAYLCGQHPKVRAADFVEVDASADVHDLTLMNMATVFLNFAAGVAARE